MQRPSNFSEATGWTPLLTHSSCRHPSTGCAGLAIEYHLFEPRQQQQRRPLVIWLHGYATRIAPKLHGEAFHRPEQQRMHQCFVLVPQAPWGNGTKALRPQGGSWAEVSPSRGKYPLLRRTPASIALLMDLVDQLILTRAIDPERLVVGGASLGGYGAWARSPGCTV